MQIEEGYVIFASGRRAFARGTIIGLPATGRLTYDAVFGGYDDFFHPTEDDEAYEDWLSPAEKTELAEHMIARWQAYRKGGDDG